MVTLLGALVALAGYTFIWDGVLMVKGYVGPARPQGPGLLDLILPSHLPKLQAALTAGPPGSSSSSSGTNETLAQAGQASAAAGGATAPGMPTGIDQYGNPSVGGINAGGHVITDLPTGPTVLNPTRR